MSVKVQENPELISIYFPNGEVHLVKGATEVCTGTEQLTFTDREGNWVVTTCPYMVTYKAVKERATDQPDPLRSSEERSSLIKEVKEGVEKGLSLQDIHDSLKKAEPGCRELAKQLREQPLPNLSIRLD